MNSLEFNLMDVIRVIPIRMYNLRLCLGIYSIDNDVKKFQLKSPTKTTNFKYPKIYFVFKFQMH
jgi:hypothetical protein